MQNKLYAQFAPSMFAICLRYSKNRQEAEDILQDGFIKVFTCLDQYKFKGPLKAWIRKIMINCALQKLRNKNLLYLVVQPDNIAEEFVDKSLIVDNINAKELILLVQDLPTMCRLIFNLYVFEGLKHREIAKLLNISEGTSKSNLHDARKLLQRKLGEQISIKNINSSS